MQHQDSQNQEDIQNRKDKKRDEEEMNLGDEEDTRRGILFFYFKSILLPLFLLFLHSFELLQEKRRKEERRRILNFHPDFDKWQGNKLNFSFETCSFFFFPTLLCCILNDRWFKHNMRKKWVQNKMKNQKRLNLCSKTSLVLLLLVFLLSWRRGSFSCCFCCCWCCWCHISSWAKGVFETDTSASFIFPEDELCRLTWKTWLPYHSLKKEKKVLWKKISVTKRT